MAYGLKASSCHPLRAPFTTRSEVEEICIMFSHHKSDCIVTKYSRCIVRFTSPSFSACLSWCKFEIDLFIIGVLCVKINYEPVSVLAVLTRIQKKKTMGKRQNCWIFSKLSTLVSSVVLNMDFPSSDWCTQCTTDVSLLSRLSFLFVC